MDLFREIKDRLTIIEVMEFYRVTPDQRNKCLCCFHNEKTPSLYAYPESNSFYCFGCGAGGSVIDFVSLMFCLCPLEAAQRINDDFGLRLIDSKPYTLTTEEYRKRQEEQQLVKQYKEWEANYYLYLCENIRLLEKLIEVTRPKEPGEPFNNDFEKAIQRKLILEYEQDILRIGDLPDKIALYLKVSRR